MAYSLNGTNRYFNAASAPVATVPLTLACWFKPSNITTDGALVIIGTNNNTGHRFGLFSRGALANDPIQADVAGASSGQASSTTSFQQGIWQHGCAVFANSASRTVYLNAGGAQTNTTNVTPAGLNICGIGARYNTSWGLYFNGDICEVGIWNIALTPDEIASLAKGMTCDKVRQQNLVLYAPLVRDIIDPKGGLTITNNNAATVAGHPRVYA